VRRIVMGARFGKAARRARVEQEVSLKSVADALGFTPAYISDIERGNRNAPSPDKVRRWAEVIKTDPEKFVFLAEVDRPSVELPIEGDPEKGELAYMLARAWPELTKEQEKELMSVVERFRGPRR